MRKNMAKSQILSKIDPSITKNIRKISTFIIKIDFYFITRYRLNRFNIKSNLRSIFKLNQINSKNIYKIRMDSIRLKVYLYSCIRFENRFFPIRIQLIWLPGRAVKADDSRP